jgi:YHS domain-containing protein
MTDHYEDSNVNGSEKKIVNDPVCQMRLAATDARESLVHEGRRYDFCSVGCRAEFQRHPEDYAIRSEESGREDV